MESAALVYHTPGAPETFDAAASIFDVDVITEHVGNLPVPSSPALKTLANATMVCMIDAVPSINEYFTAFNIAGVALFTLGGLAVIIVMALYVVTLRHVMMNAPPLVKTHSAFVLSVYPVVAVATYCATVVPRAQLLAEALTQGMFMASLYQLFCLVVAYCGGEAELIRRVKPDSLNPRVAPCCCWPCCSYVLPLFAVNKDHVRILRMLVLQLPVVQGFVYVVLLVMWAEEQSLYQVNYLYMQPVVIMSILCGIWGMIMTLRMLADVLKEHHIQGKFVVLQMVLLLAKLQSFIGRVVVWSDLLPCKPPISPTVYANLIYNSLMLWEMVLLSVLARMLYKRPIPDITNTSPSPQQICTLNDKIPISAATRKESNNNTSIVVRF